jgi:hypothetical protein
MSVPMAWLMATHGLEALGGAEIDAIRDFTLLWSLFEGKAMGTRGTQNELAAAVERMALPTPLQAAFLEALAFWRNRYWLDGVQTHAFRELGFAENPHREQVIAVLSGVDNAPLPVATALLQVAMRLRNNLFHGAKWRYGIRDQLANFTHANSILMLAIEMSPDPPP